MPDREFALKSVALGRWCQPGDVPSLELMYSVYRAGYYHCGVKADGSLAAFDPTSLNPPC